MDDARYARFKRAWEYYQVDPAFREGISREPAQMLTPYLLDPANAEPMKTAVTLLGTQMAARNNTNPFIMEYYRRYQLIDQYVLQTTSEDQYTQEALFRYEERIRKRTSLESAVLRLHTNIKYFPIATELSDGCKVQCSFCGLSAPRWKRDYSYAEGRTLWREIVEINHKVIGQIASEGPLYFASEPFDNPDYIRFLQDEWELTGRIPQTTTAARPQDLPRIRELCIWLKEIGMLDKARLRLSIRNLPQFHRIMEYFSPEELVDVEILANNPESMNMISASGRELEQRDTNRYNYRYSICCVSGVKVNLERKEMIFLETCMPDEKWPQGYRVREVRSFENAADYEQHLKDLYGLYAIPEVTETTNVALNTNVRTQMTEDAILLVGDQIGYKIPNNVNTQELLKMLQKGSSMTEILHTLSQTGDLDPTILKVEITKLVNVMFQKGYVLDM